MAKPKMAKPEIKFEQPEVKPVETKPQFKNNGDGIKIKLIDGEDFKWITVKSGEIVSIPRKIAKANKLQEVK